MVITPCSAADLELIGLRDNGEAMRKTNSGKTVRQEQIVIRVFIHCADTCPGTAPKKPDDTTEKEQCETSLSLRGLKYARTRRLAPRITAEDSVIHCIPSSGELRQLSDKYTESNLKS